MNDLTDAWLEWRETCELDKCAPEHINQLCVVSNSMFRRAIRKLPEGTACIEQLSSLLPDTDEQISEIQERNAFRHTFRLMECELLPAGEKTERQQFKDRIFNRAQSPGYVTGYFLRAFFRSYVKKKENLSYCLPELPEDSSVEAAENQQHNAMKDNGDLPEQKSPDQIEGELLPVVKEFWSGLTERQRAALYTYHYHMTMSNERLLKKVGCCKTVFSDIPKQKLEELMTLAQNKYRITERSDISQLIADLQDCYNEWEKESELGRWILEHTEIPDKPGGKIRFH